MKRLKKTWIWLLLTFLLLGCGAKEVQTENQEETSQAVVLEETALEEEAIKEGEEASEIKTWEVEYPVTIVDQLGREVTIEKEPQTLVSGYYITTSLLIALDQEDKLVGIEKGAGERNIYSLSAPQLQELPSMGSAKEFNLEGCAQLNPDLVILPFKLKDVADSLEQLGITVLFVKPENQELLQETMEILGVATNSRERSSALQKMIEEKSREMISVTEKCEKPSVYISGNSDFLSTAGSSMYQNSLIENAGGKNVASEISDASWAEVSYEQLLAWNPEYIILAADAKFSVESVLEDGNLAECDAVKNGNVYQMPNEIESWDSPVPGSVLGSLWLASILHQEEYSQSMYEESVEEFYTTFYEFSPF